MSGFIENGDVFDKVMAAAGGEMPTEEEQAEFREVFSDVFDDMFADFFKERRNKKPKPRAFHVTFQYGGTVGTCTMTLEDGGPMTPGRLHREREKMAEVYGVPDLIILWWREFEYE